MKLYTALPKCTFDVIGMMEEHDDGNIFVTSCPGYEDENFITVICGWKYITIAKRDSWNILDTTYMCEKWHNFINTELSKCTHYYDLWLRENTGGWTVTDKATVTELNDLFL